MISSAPRISMHVLSCISLRVLRFLTFRWNKLRATWVRAMLRAQGVVVGDGVYIGPHVEFHLQPNATLKLGNNVCIREYSRIAVHEHGTLEIGANTFIG